ncbi:MAG: NAD-dependent epimerase/dehydratase family protein [Nanoarchaeota archaeon]|nr:NAD-dependent epimerase/dehydratase family protein [Nanoarchaeota archaeon]
MRIAFVNDTFIEGRGADTVIYELARRLGKEHEVFVLAGQTDIKEENFKFIRLNLEKLYTGKIKDFNFLYKIIRLRKEIRKIQKTYNFDVFNVFHSSLNLAFKDFPTIVTWLGSPETNNYFRKSINKVMLRTLKNGKTVVISKYLRNKLNFLKNVEVIPCGLSKEFKPKSKERGYMLYVGRLEKHKSIYEIIRLSKDLNFPLKIAGYGPLENELKNYAKRISANKVVFLGKVSNKKLISLYQECNFFISASKWEGFGLIFIEAGACAKPSIGYKMGAIPEVIVDGKTGFLVENFSELKKRAEELIKNKKARTTMGKEALKFSKIFNWDKSVKEYEKLFEAIKNNSRIDYENKKVLVNGVSGFIGSRLAKELLKGGAKVYSIDNFSYINIKLMKKKFPELKKIKVIKGDVSNKDSWDKLPKDIEYIFHFSAPSSIVLFKKYPERCYNETVWGLQRAFEFAKENGVKKVIYPSSGNIYSGNEMPHIEIAYPRPRNLYGAAKIACESLANSYTDYVKSIGLRIFAGYGPGEEWKGDFGSAPYLFIRDLINGKAPEIWGDGEQTRDLIYIDDVVAMILKSAEISYTGIVNVGTGESLSFKDLIKKIKYILNSDIDPVFVKREINYVEHAKADVTLNKKLFGIKPISADEGLRKFIDYLKASS